MSNPSATQPPLPAAALTQFKEFVRELSTEFDDELTRHLRAAVLEIQKQTTRQLIQTQFTYKLDDFPACYYLPPYPLVSVAEVTYIDTNGTRVTWSASNYDVITDGLPGYLRPIYNGTYPGDHRARPEPIAIYICGDGTEWTDVPEDVADVVFMLAETYYRGTDWGDLYNQRLDSIRIGDEHLAYTTR